VYFESQIFFACTFTWSHFFR